MPALVIPQPVLALWGSQLCLRGSGVDIANSGVGSQLGSRASVEWTLRIPVPVGISAEIPAHAIPKLAIAKLAKTKLAKAKLAIPTLPKAKLPTKTKLAKQTLRRCHSETIQMPSNRMLAPSLWPQFCSFHLFPAWGSYRRSLLQQGRLRSWLRSAAVHLYWAPLFDVCLRST